jgi:hypothetical protein
LPQSQGESAPNVGEFASKVGEESAPKVGESNFGDSSGALFSMYFKAAEEEDNKMADRWQKDAEGLLIFVSPRVGIRVSLCITWSNIDWFILCCRRCAAFRVTPEPNPQQSRYLFILSWKHLSGSRRPECNTPVHPCAYIQATSVFSSEICHLG